MKVVILAGGLGTRISEETSIKPKPMVEIGGKPIIWHIMKIYSFYGFNDFIICCGYKGYIIKEFFSNYLIHNSDFTVNTLNNKYSIHNESSEDWNVTLLDTGEDTMTGGRVLRTKPFIGDERFMLTYGDGVSNCQIDELVKSHIYSKAEITITSVLPQGRFGALGINHTTNKVYSFKEKPKGDGVWINGGFMVCESTVFNYLENDNSILEQEPLSKLAEEGKMNTYKHEGFWKPMDTLKDKMDLESMWNSNNALWKVW